MYNVLGKRCVNPKPGSSARGLDLPPQPPPNAGNDYLNSYLPMM